MSLEESAAADSTSIFPCLDAVLSARSHSLSLEASAPVENTTCVSKNGKRHTHQTSALAEELVEVSEEVAEEVSEEVEVGGSESWLGPSSKMTDIKTNQVGGRDLGSVAPLTPPQASSEQERPKPQASVSSASTSFISEYGAVPADVSENDLSAQKLASIMSFLDGVEKNQESEGSQIADAAAPPASQENNKDDDTFSVSSFSTALTETTNRAQQGGGAAASVRRKIEALRHQLRLRTDECEALQEQLRVETERRGALLETAEAERDAVTSRLKAEHEEASKRHLAFVDQLLADKAELAERCTALAEELRKAEVAAAEADREGRARLHKELASQKDMILASEKRSREKWMETKAKEIKEMTVKGLEPEIHKLMERHRAEVDRIEQANSDALKRQHADITAQHEAHIRQLRDRMAQEQADAVERERSMGAAKAREACERAEQQMQLGRMRLQAEADLRLERAEQSKREERDRHASALAAAKEEHAAALAAATAASNERMETAGRRAESAAASAKQEFAAEKEAFQRVTVERARKELAEKEAHIRQMLTAERDAELKRVIARLETEAEERLRSELREREATMETLRTRGASDLAAERERVHALTLRLNECLETTRRAEETAARSGERAHQLDMELQRTKEAADSARMEVATMQLQVQGSHGAAAAAEAQAQVQVDELRTALASRDASLADISSRHRRELEDVEARVRVALARKDETIASLREQMSAVMLQVTEAATYPLS